MCDKDKQKRAYKCLSLVSMDIIKNLKKSIDDDRGKR
jgi:hypothetical protein